jgi:hypothetical protein
MSKYKFLIRPVFYIFNLFFATWLVIKIESVSPSDFGRYKLLFERTEPKLQHVPVYDKYYIFKLAEDYKKERIDQKTFLQLLSSHLDAVNKNALKKK